MPVKEIVEAAMLGGFTIKESIASQLFGRDPMSVMQEWSRSMLHNSAAGNLLQFCHVAPDCEPRALHDAFCRIPCMLETAGSADA